MLFGTVDWLDVPHSVEHCCKECFLTSTDRSTRKKQLIPTYRLIYGFHAKVFVMRLTSFGLKENKDNIIIIIMGLYFTQDKDTYPMLQLFMNTVKHNKIK